MTSIYIKRLELVDENNNKLFSLYDCSANKGMKRAINFIRVKDGDRSFKKIIRDLDDDFKIMIGLKNE